MRLVRRLLIILLVILCFAGCSKKTNEEYAVSGERATYVYTSKTVEFFELDSYFYLRNVVKYNDCYYAFTQKYTQDDVYNVVYCIDSNGNIVSEYDVGLDINIYASVVIEDNKIIYTTWSNKVEIYDMDSESIISSVQYEHIIGGVQKASDGYIVLAQGRIYKYNNDWHLEKTVINDDWRYYNGTNLYYEENGKSYLIADTGFRWKYYEIDFNNQTSALVYNPSADNSRPLSCSAQYVFDNNGLAKYDFVNSTVVPLTNWNCMNLQPAHYWGATPSYTAIDDNEFLQIYEYDNGLAELVIYTYDPTLDYSDRTEITIGGFNARSDISLAWAVYKFNTSQDEYRIVFDDYSDRFAWEDSQTNQNTLVELIQYFNEGNAPDIFYGNYFDYTSLAESGDVIDIYPYLADRVGDDGFAALSDSVEQLMIDENNHCYTVFSSYQMDGFAGLTSEIGTETNLSIDDVISLASQFDKPLYNNITANRLAVEAILYTIDRDNGYTDEEMSTIVNYAVSYGIGDYSDYSNVFSDWSGDGDTVIQHVGLFSANSWYDNETNYGGPLTFIGYPTINGGVKVATPFGQVAVSSTSEHPDACCDFIATLWDYDVQTICATAWLIPVNDECFRNSVYYITDFDSIPDEDYLYRQFLSMYHEVPLDTAERYIEAVYSVNAVEYHDWGIQAIVEDEVNQYFIDDKPISDIVEILQSRLSVYLSE